MTEFRSKCTAYKVNTSVVLVCFVALKMMSWHFSHSTAINLAYTEGVLYAVKIEVLGTKSE